LSKVKLSIELTGGHLEFDPSHHPNTESKVTPK